MASAVSVVVARIRPPDVGRDAATTPPSTADELRAVTGLAAVARAAAPFLDGPVDAVAHASTTSAYAVGHRAEGALLDELRLLCGVPVAGSASSAVQALRADGARRVALVHPRWFDVEMDQLGVDYFRDQGFDVILAKATGLSGDPSKIRARTVVEWVGRHLPDEADAVFIAGNGFRAAGAIDELERRTGRLVLEANQVLLWSILAATRTACGIAGYGRLLREPA